MEGTHKLLGVALATAIGATSCATQEPIPASQGDGTPTPAAPRCEITNPSVGMLSARDGEGNPGSFTATFVVRAEVENGQPVTLSVDARAPITTSAAGGTAIFREVILGADGLHRVRATCAARDGRVGESTERVYDVDATPPMIAVTQPSAGTLIGIVGDVNPAFAGIQFNVCARSDSPGNHLCARVAGTSPDNAPGCVTTAGTAPACVELTCPDGAVPFDLDVSTQDGRGNLSSTTIGGVRCQSTLPAVRVVGPVGRPTGPMGATLNASHDTDRTTPGLQTDVVACVDRTVGAASLLLNDSPSELPVELRPVAPGDECASLSVGFTGIARFRNVTLPETPSGTTAGVHLRAIVTDEAGDTGGSVPVGFTVDSTPPRLSLRGCDRYEHPATPGAEIDTTLEVESDATPVRLTLRRDGDTPLTLTSDSLVVGVARFEHVVLSPGRWALTAAAEDEAGNTGTTVDGCTVHVADPPLVVFESPTSRQAFSTAPAGTAVRLHTDAPEGTPVQLEVDGVPAGSVLTDAEGNASFEPVALPEGDAVMLRATTQFVPGRGTGVATVHVKVDTAAPSGVGEFTLLVPEETRRAGVVHLSWQEASDPSPTGPRRVFGYEIRRSNAPITQGNFADATVEEATLVPGAPGAQGGLVVSGLTLGAETWFAIRPFDALGHGGPISITGPVSLAFHRDALSTPSLALGQQISGGHDTDGDGFSDVLVAARPTDALASGVARLYLGSRTGLGAERYVEFTGSASEAFGSQAVSLGDVNGDGLGDLAIAAPGAPVSPGSAGAVYVFFGRTAWRPGPSGYTSADADMVIRGGAGAFEHARLGAALARAGDFNGDGLADLALGAPEAAGGGAVCVVLGRTALPAELEASHADVILRNASGLPSFGRALSNGGRLVGGDAREDLVVTAGETGGATRLFVFGGRSIRGTEMVFTTRDASMEVDGAGLFAAPVGDVDGNGFEDLAVGGPTGTRLFFGTVDGGLLEGPEVSGGTTAIASISSAWSAQSSLLAARARSADLVMARGGTLKLFAGRAAGLWGSPLISAVSYPLGGETAVASMAWVGDVDGDGYADLAVGRPGEGGSVIVIR